MRTDPSSPHRILDRGWWLALPFYLAAFIVRNVPALQPSPAVHRWGLVAELIAMLLTLLMPISSALVRVSFRAVLVLGLVLQARALLVP